MAYNPANPLEPINSPYRARRAAEGGEIAAFVIAGYYAFTAALIYFHKAPVRVLLSQDPRVLAAFQLLLAAVAVLLGFAVRARSSRWPLWLLAAWAVLECLPFITGPLLGHAARFPMSAGIMLAAIQGVRGASALRRLGSPAEPGPTLAG